MLIAEDFTVIYNFVAYCALALVALAVVSFVPASRGHWSAVVLAAPAVIVGGYFTGANLFSSSRDQIIGFWWFYCSAPLVVGACAIGWWAACRYAKRLAASQTKA